MRRRRQRRLFWQRAPQAPSAAASCPPELARPLRSLQRCCSTTLHCYVHLSSVAFLGLALSLLNAYLYASKLS